MTGEELKILRQGAGVSARELATRMGISGASISYYENGTRDIPSHMPRSFVRAIHKIANERLQNVKRSQAFNRYLAEHNTVSN